MKTVQQLAQANNDKKIGSHQVKYSKQEEGTRFFIYYNTTICTVDDVNKTFSIDASYGTQSTTRACNAYRRHFLDEGYSEIV
ncbi:hypothetical protein [Paenibacillus sp. Mc5Re-14]|uniref:hypothetical protein n=1 Tax=Paenibacillus sp. Mc5Re-14 TaxID=1030529 RepID=UPI000A7BB19A|nr:hypothetical protein [Paenibacillus sp. Mc5Re-14]